MVYQGPRKRPRVCEANMNLHEFFRPPVWRITRRAYRGRFAGCCMDDQDRFHIVAGDSYEDVRNLMIERYGEEHVSGAHILNGKIPLRGGNLVFSVY